MAGMQRVTNRRLVQSRPVSGQRPRVLQTASGVMGVVVLSLMLTGEVTAQQATGAPRATGPDRPNTLAGCRLPLPGGGDQDSGLGELYVENRQGRPFLFAPSLTLRQTYSDNVNLQPKSFGQRDSDWVTQLIPAMSLCRSSPRLRTQLDYQAEITRYQRDSDRDDVFHRLNSDNSAVLVSDRVFLDFGATYDQRQISSRGAFSDDNILDTDNRTDAITLRASPYVVQDLGRVGTSVVRYTYNRTNYQEDVANLERHTGSAQVTSPAGSDPLTWQASVRSERVNRSNVDRAEYFDDAFLQLGYRVIGRLTVLGRVGAETENRIDGTRDRFGSDYWEAGARWADDRTSIEGRYGRRFFGDTYFAAISRRTSRHVGSLSYRETQQVSDRFTVLSPEDLGLPRVIEDPVTGDPLELPDIVVAENEIFLSRRTTATSNFATGRSTLRISGFYEEREYLVTEEDEERIGVAASLRWQWLPRTAVIPRASWEQLEFRDGRKDTIRGFRLSLAHLLSPQMQAGLTVRRQSRSSHRAEDEYVENAVSAQITRVF